MTDIFIIDKTIILDRFVNEGTKSLKSNPIRFKNKSIPSHNRRNGENNLPILGNKTPAITEGKTETKSKTRVLLSLELLL